MNFEDDYDFRAALATPNMMLGDFPITIGRARNPVNRQAGDGRNGGGNDRPHNNNGFSDEMRDGRGRGRDYDRM